jgi:hypothetical protein
MTGSTPKGPAPGTDIRLPVRAKPVPGEAITSYSRRLSEANSITTHQLVRLCGSDPAHSREARHVLADRAGLSRDEFDSLTLTAARNTLFAKPHGWRLKTTVWKCRTCSHDGIELALRGFAIQFLCLRCGTFLSRPEELDAAPIPASEDLFAFQQELLYAVPARSHRAIATRFTRFRQLIKTVGSALPPSEALEFSLTESEAALSAAWRRSRTRDLPLGLPEVPRLVGAVLSKTWEQTASSNAHFLQTRALREFGHREFRRAVVYEEFSDIDPAGYMRRCSREAAATETVGEQVRHLFRSHGLRSRHVPEEVRYRSDPFLIDATVWRWRRHVCRQLRLWLLQIELSDDVIASRRERRPAPRPVDRRLEQVRKSFYAREAIIGDFTAETAQTVLSQMLHLGQNIVQEVTSYADPRVRLTPRLLQQFAPSAIATGSNAVDLARAWMWLDEVAGQDAYGYLPMIPPHLMEKFDHSLRPDERLSLREYRIRQQTAITQDIALGASIASPAALHA